MIKAGCLGRNKSFTAWALAMRTESDVEAYLLRMNRRFRAVEDQPGTFLVEPGGMPPVAVRVDPPLVVVRVHIGEAARGVDEAAFYRKLLELNARELVHASYGIDRGLRRPLERAGAREPRFQRAPGDDGRDRPRARAAAGRPRRPGPDGQGRGEGRTERTAWGSSAASRSSSRATSTTSSAARKIPRRC